MSLEQGYQYYKAGNFQKAAEVFHSLLEEDENNAKVWNLLGICLTKLGEHEDALTCFENALILDPDNDVYIQNKRKCKHKISKKVLDRVTSIPEKKNDNPPIHYSPPAKSHIPKSKILYFFLGLFALYLILGVTGSYSIGSGPEFFSFLSGVGIIFQEKISNIGFLGGLFSPPVSNDSCEPYYTYHIIPEIIPNGRTDIDFLDITRTETRITFKNKSVLTYRYIPGECKKGQDSFGDKGLFSRRDMNQNTLMEGDIIIFPTNAPEVDVFWINPESTVIRFKGGKWYAHAHIK